MTTVGAQFDRIPRILHQTWKTREIPDEWQAYHASWHRHLPEWEHRLWTDQECRQLVCDRYPWFLPTFDGFPRQIQRVDASKYLILHAHGGVYADLDCECLKPIDPLIQPGGAIVGRTKDGVIECAFLGSSAAHPFWELVLGELQSPPLSAKLLRGMPGFDCSHVLLSTGTQMLRRAVSRYAAACRRTAGAAGLTIYDPECFSSRSWLARHEPFEHEDLAYVHHHYTDSWLKPDEVSIHQYFTTRHVKTVGRVAGISAIAAALVWVWLTTSG